MIFEVKDDEGVLYVRAENAVAACNRMESHRAQSQEDFYNGDKPEDWDGPWPVSLAEREIYPPNIKRVLAFADDSEFVW